MNRRANHLLQFGSFTLNIAEQRLLREGRAVALKPKIFRLLVTMVENRGQLLEKNDLIKELWPDRFVEEGNLAVSIHALRKALGDNSRQPQYIETVPGRGYRFIARVTQRET